ncbi:MAG: hypothetical protein KatS3mg102_2177 [Planctomycetota bacterium]|nr:MAG: hypothetical protein KatS3mg102_2177 [Planctomycetota bacterium]
MLPGGFETGASAACAWASVLVATALLARALVAGPAPSGRRGIAWAALALACVPALLVPESALALAAAVVLLGVAFAAGAEADAGGQQLESRIRERWWDAVIERPASLLVVTFLALAALGTVVLLLPAASTRAAGIAPVDALFTAVSACCVTGLVVLDTGRDFTGFGQAVILALIQLGGLGIMTFSTAAFVLLRRRLSVRHEGAVAGIVGSRGRADLFVAVRTLLAVTAVTELVGACVLAAVFAAREPLGAAGVERGVHRGLGVLQRRLHPGAGQPRQVCAVPTGAAHGGAARHFGRAGPARGGGPAGAGAPAAAGLGAAEARAAHHGGAAGGVGRCDRVAGVEGSAAVVAGGRSSAQRVVPGR